jgi:TolB-like protein
MLKFQQASSSLGGEAMLYRFGDFSLDTGRFELVSDRQVVSVEPQAMKLITYLIENRDRVVSREELQRHLWGAQIVSDNALSVCMKTARSALGDDGRRQSLIRTVPRVGYRFIADADARSSPSIEIEHRESDGDEREQLKMRDAEFLARPSVVVLPLANIGDSQESIVLSQGLTHDITTRIARTRCAFVIARGTAFQFEGQYPDVRAVGKKLGVRYVVHGAVQLSGKKMHITATLSDAVGREEIWSENYDRKIGDFAAVQAELAELIVASLQSEVERAERLRSLLIPSTNLDAWSAFHRGCWHMYRFRDEDIDHAERFFRQSIDLEPTVPRPYAGLSFICFERVFLNIGDDRASGIQQAFDYGQQALAIDPHDPMALWALSRAYLLQGNLEASRESLETAIELNPSYAVAQYSLGWVGLQLGDNELCKSRIEMARKLSPYDPLKFAMLGVYGLNLALMGRTEEAVSFAAQSVVQPNAHYQVNAFAAVTHALDGQLRKGARLLRRVHAVAPEYTSQDFLAVFKFKQEADITRITRAFSDLERYIKAH